MTWRNVIVTSRSVQEALSSREAATTESLASAFKDDAQAAARLAAFWTGVGMLQTEDRNNGVMVAPGHQAASLLQSFLSERALERADRLETLPAGGEEAKFDEKDWLGWAGSFFTWWRKIKPHAWIQPPSEPDVVSN